MKQSIKCLTFVAYETNISPCLLDKHRSLSVIPLLLLGNGVLYLDLLSSTLFTADNFAENEKHKGLKCTCVF